MATLEKIRKKSVLLIVIIGAALLAFILGDALTNGRTLFGSGTTVAKLGDTKVDISEYQQRLEMLQAANPDADGQELSQFVINSLIEEKLLDEAAEKLGIEVSDEMVTFMIMDNPQEPMQRFVSANASYIQQIYPNLTQEQIANPRFIHGLIFSPEKYGLKPDMVEPLKQNWLAMEQETKNAARRILYQQLLSGLIQPNSLDKQDLFANDNESSTVDFVVKRFANLDNIKVSDAELQAEYEKTKNRYKVNEDTKTVDFLSYHVTPSDADRKNAEKLQAQALEAMKSNQKLSKDLVKAGVQSKTARYSASALRNPAIAQFLSADSVPVAVGSIKAFPGLDGSFEIVKVLGAGNTANDGVELVQMMVDKEVEADVKAALAAGTSVDSLTLKFGDGKVQVAPQPQNIALQNPDDRSALPADMAARLDTVAAGVVLDVQAAPEGNILAYVKTVKPRVPVYDLETVSYTLYPSKETIEKASEAMAKYAAANNTPAKFQANAQKAGYNFQAVPVNGSTPGFPINNPQDQMSLSSNPQAPARYYPMASKLVSWAVTDAEPGNISEVVTNENSQNPYIYIAMVENEYEDFAPWNDTAVKKDLEARVRASKAGDDLVKKFSGKGDINATAQAMGEALVTDEMVRFNKAQRISDPKVLARIAGTPAGQKVVLVKGNDGVYAFVVKSKNPATVKMDEKQVKNVYNNAFNARANHSKMMRGNKRMENNLYKMTGTR